jgi:adenylate cyclase
MDQIARKVLLFDRFALDLTRGNLRKGAQDIDLRPKAFDVLRHLAENAGRLVPKDELYQAVWPDIAVTDDSLVQCIGELRHKLGDEAHTLIKTVPRRGYLLDVQISAGDDAAVQPSPITTGSSSALSLPDKPSIAVLPFTNMSDDPDQEYFSDGMTEDIITALSRLRWFFVIARNSTFTYKGQRVDVRQVGRELGVRYVLEGSVRKSGERVRITSQLLDAITGNHIWSERYDRDLTDIFALQDEITASVTAAIEPKLLAAEGLRAQARSNDDLDAWDLVARALSHFWKLTAAESQTAIDLLRQAVQTHPDYAPAHSLLAFVILISFNVGRIPTRSEREFANELAHRAVELDDSDPWAHIAMGYVAFVARKNTKESVRHFDTALDLNPNFATATSSVGLAFTFNGQSDEAILRFERALRMSPRDPFKGIFFAAISAAHYLAGRYLQAVEWARKAVEMRPGNLGALRILCASLAQAGEIEESKAAMRTLRQLQPGLSIAWIKQWVPYTSGPMTHFLEGMRKAGLTD